MATVIKYHGAAAEKRALATVTAAIAVGEIQIAFSARIGNEVVDQIRTFKPASATHNVANAASAGSAVFALPATTGVASVPSVAALSIVLLNTGAKAGEAKVEVHVTEADGSLATGNLTWQGVLQPADSVAHHVSFQGA